MFYLFGHRALKTVINYSIWLQNFFDLFKVSKITTNFFDLFKVSKQPSKKKPSKKQLSMHCLKHNITMSKKITIIQSQILTPTLTLIQCQFLTPFVTLVQCLQT